MEQTPAIPEDCQWAVFLRNHDELTLEMVTDEDRDYMYRVYAQDPEARINLGIRRRLAPLLGNDRRRMELMNGLLFSLPGAPIIYYGDEIGMGDNFYLGDRNGVRTPMQWSGDRNAGFSRANPQKLYLPVTVDPEYHYETVNVEAQLGNPHSILWWMKRLIALRKRHQAFARGDIEFLHPENRQVLAFTRTYGGETILVVANVSRFVQYAELDLSKYRGMTPVEMFGRNQFPRIGELPYFITIGPHMFYWFTLEPSAAEEAAMEMAAEPPQLPAVTPNGSWSRLMTGKPRAALESALPAYLSSRRWFRAKARKMQWVRITDVIPIDRGVDKKNPDTWLLLCRVSYTRGEQQTYSLPLTVATGEEARRVLTDLPQSVVAKVPVTGADETYVLYESLADESFANALLESIAKRRRLAGEEGQLVAATTPAFRRLRGDPTARLEPTPLRVEQSNTSIAYGDRFILKLFRQPDEGLNPDLEIGTFLTERKGASVPAVAGYIEYRRPRRQPLTLGILQEYVRNEGDAWRFTLDHLRRYLEAVVSEVSVHGAEDGLETGHPLDLVGQEPPPIAADTLGMRSYFRSAQLLGQRTAELHLVLSSDPENADFAPEPFTQHYQRGLYQSMRTLVAETLPLLKRRIGELPEDVQAEAKEVLSLEGRLTEKARVFLGPRIKTMRIRTHGDYHLGQVLYTGMDFVIIDFEGEPLRPLSERRLKRSPLRDVAGMLRSFNYASQTALFEQADAGLVAPERFETAEKWTKVWTAWACAGFLTGYLNTLGDSPIVPADRDEQRAMLDSFLLEKAVYELSYELNNRPDWVRIPLRGILELMKEGS
jgi:maltose alpha-D-glucosyltransferase/alpha-amylase